MKNSSVRLVISGFSQTVRGLDRGFDSSTLFDLLSSSATMNKIIDTLNYTASLCISCFIQIDLLAIAAEK